MTGTTAADILWEALHREGVEVVFGHPGGAILPVYDALYRFGSMRHVLTRHEQGAAHAADGYARATGRVGVCLATSGPGATNLVTGLATAMMDGVPVVAVTGQVSRSVIGTQAFQETDIIGVTMPVTKHGFLVQDPEEIGPIIQEAFHLARSGRPGPVLVDFPKCVQREPCRGLPRRGFAEGRFDVGADKAFSERPSETETDHSVTWGAVERTARLLAAAKRPVVMAGRGVVLSDTSDVLRRLAEKCDLPVVTTLLGLDGFAATDARALGMPGMHGTERANHAIQESDLVLGLGLRFDDRVVGAPGTFAPGARVIHFDVSPATIGRTVDVDVAVLGDLSETMPCLLSRVRSKQLPEWWLRLLEWNREVPLPPASVESPDRLSSRRTLRALAHRIAKSGAVVATDVGQHQMWVGQELRDADPRTHLTSGGLGTMGYALPAAIGAACGATGRPVWVVAGDGGFQMTVQELATVVQERLPLRIAVVNNGFLGMVRQWQEFFYERRYSATAISGPDFVALAQAYGITARAVERPDEVENALDWAEAMDGPVLLDLRVQQEENVYPMVPTGHALHEMVTEPAAV